MKTRSIFLFVLMGSVILASSSCSLFRKPAVEKPKTVFFPPSPDTARFQFLTVIKSSQDVTKPRTRLERYVFGEEVPMGFRKPYGVNVRNGKIYVTDMGIGMVIIDLNKKTFDHFNPQGPGQLQVPINCYADEKNTLFVADSKRGQVVVFDSTGRYLSSFGDTARFRPTDVFVYKDKILVANIVSNKIFVYDRDSLGKFLYSFPESSVGEESYLYSPVSVWAWDDKVYVSDIGGFNVKVYTLDGKYLQTIGSEGKSPGQFARNKGIAVDRESNVFAVDAAFENVQIFNKEGHLLMAIGGPYNGPGYLWLPAKVTVDYENLDHFKKFVEPGYELKYLVLVTNQYGPDKVTIYGRIEDKRQK